MERNIYLNMKTLEEAKEITFKRFQNQKPLDNEVIAVNEALGRVLSKPVFAKISSPNFHAAAMDGVAVKASNTFGASEGNPKILNIGNNAFYVNTGHVMPENTDAVIMIENINTLDDNKIEINAPAYPWQYVRKVGEDIVATELLFPQNHLITPYCIGAIISGGVFCVSVKKKPKVLIIPTGSEIFDWRTNKLEDLKPGNVIESNSYVLGKLVESYNAEFKRHEIIRDDTEKIKNALLEAVNKDFDIILIIGGSSAGSEDFVNSIVSGVGEVFIHGVTIMPGKPIIIGEVKNKPVFGIPGYPVSAIIAFEQFVGPIICKMLCQPEPERQTIMVEPTRKIPSKLGIEEFLRVKLGVVEDRIVANPLPRGAGNITSITEADGIIRIPNNVEGIKEFQPVSAQLLKPFSSIKNTIVVIGSHDNTLDIIADEIKKKHSHLTFSSSNVGSMGGLMAIKKGVCHLAGSHLLDTSDGSYNVSYIKKVIPDKKVKLINLVFRDQGLIIPRGNPKKIKGIEDLARPDIVFINRQGGSGTRILLDFRLSQLNISPENIKGYANEEFTHMSVAVAVLSKAADAGLGILSAAQALNLDFIPVVTEQYDLVIPETFFNTEKIQILLNTIRTLEFKKRIESLGGYHTHKTGEIIEL